MKSKYLPLLSTIVGFLLFFFLFYQESVHLLDPDFGYRFRTGQLILKGIIPKVDIYSYTMPSFPYVEHAIAVAAFWASAYPLIGYRGIALFHGLFASFALYLATKRIPKDFLTKHNYLQIVAGKNLGVIGWFPLLLAVVTILPYTGIRAQVISWVLISVFLNITLPLPTWNKWKWIIPFIFIAWANIHGSWSAGIAILAALTIIRSFKEKRILWSDAILTLLSFGATLITPYGTGIWREVWLSLSDSEIRWHISEWMPPFVSVDFGFIFFLTVSVFFVTKYRNSLSSDSVLVYFLVLSQALLSRRHIPLWVFVSLPLTMQALGMLFQEVKTIKFAKKRFATIYSISWVASLLIMTTFSFLTIQKGMKVSETNYYPDSALIYLKENKGDGNIFAFYGWGGYLIWKYPEEKVFIDGRMPSWRWDSPEGELSNAFSTYNNILSGEESYKEIFQKFNVRYILIPPEQQKPYDPLVSTIESIKSKFGEEETVFNLYEKLLQDSWEVVYEDEKSVLYYLPH